MIDKGTFFDIMLAFDKKGYLMSASTPGEDLWTENGGAKQESGLIMGHAYSIITVAKTKEGVQLLKLRNPWGQFEWDGDFSDGHKSWTKDIIA